MNILANFIFTVFLKNYLLLLLFYYYFTQTPQAKLNTCTCFNITIYIATTHTIVHIINNHMLVTLRKYFAFLYIKLLRLGPIYIHLSLLHPH